MPRTITGNKTLTFLLACSCFLLAWLAVIGTASTCDTYDINGTPIGNHRICSVYESCDCPGIGNFCHGWRSGYCSSVNGICFPLDCSGFVGMNLTYECSFEGARLYKYQDGEYRYLNGSSVNYGFLLPEHAGLYECRNSTNYVVRAQNLTVNGE